MTDVEFWTLIINGVAAASTTAAVILSLYLILKKGKRFHINSYDFSGVVENFEKIDERLEVFLNIEIQNYVEFEMNILQVGLQESDGRTGYYWPMKIAIAPYSRHIFRVEINKKIIEVNKIDNPVLVVRTNFGDRVRKLNQTHKKKLENFQSQNERILSRIKALKEKEAA